MKFSFRGTKFVRDDHKIEKSKFLNYNFQRN